MVEIAPGAVVNLYLLGALGLGIGLIAGFAGVSGGYLLTPMLIVLGFPAPTAVGTALALMTANNLIGLLRHRELGHLDAKMGLIMAAGSVTGVEFGVHLLNQAKQVGPAFADNAVLAATMVTLAAVGASMVLELWRSSRRLLSEIDVAAQDIEVRTVACRFLQSLCVFPHIRFTKSKLRISGWIVFLLGAIIGVLSGFLGSGGAFMASPALIYLVGQPSLMAVGTNLMGSFVGVCFSCFRHAMLGHVQLGIALVMLLGTAVGTYIGASGTSLVKGLAIRYVLAASVVAALLGPAVKLAWFLTGARIIWLDNAARAAAIGQVFLPVVVVVLLLTMAYRHARGKPVPSWAERLMVTPRAA
ncbi:MAG: sulfite exporter TauE/SafE family protein [Armatimonadota bacterium]